VTHLFRCPYHGWTYSLEGELKGTPDFAGVCHFEKGENGLVPVAAGVWENFVFVRLDRSGPGLEEFLGADLMAQFRPLGQEHLHFLERRHYLIDCNWKVFADNYLDGGYHIPHLHKGLDSVLDYTGYTIENGSRHCLQSSPVVSKGAERETGAVRKGERALYYWIYPNFMVNWYEGMMDTNLVSPRGVDKTEVIFDFYFADVSAAAREKNLASVAVGHRIQEEDLAICKSVAQFGAYDEFEKASFPAGKETPTIVYCEVENFQSRQADPGRWETKLSYEAALYNNQGADRSVAVWSKKPTNVVDECRNRRRDFFLADRFAVPANLPVGQYVLKVTVIDQLANHVAEKSVSIIIAGD
jgi:phenylpropionate dioxygenase-like ring-hydroxylating dioxygenase large terminal subunit